jgi:uncharacterized protein YecE (DUF72 family)
MKKQQKGLLSIGTSNIVVPGSKLSFPREFQQKSRLHYYSTLFNTVELNSTFYKVPMASTFAKWSGEVGQQFLFTIKLSKEITHGKNLQYDLTNIDRFLNAADGLDKKKGCLLVQFPGKISLQYYAAVEKILQRIVEMEHAIPWRTAVEFRHPDWYVSETFELMDEYGASVVLHDIPKAKNVDLNKGAGFVYLRFHGPAGDYRGSYTDHYLVEQAANIEAWLKDGKDVFAYFNNTIGEAFNNANTLKSMAEK